VRNLQTDRADDLLFQTLRSTFHPDDRHGSLATFTPTGADWFDTLRRAEQLEVGPMFARFLLSKKTAPRELREAAERIYERNLARNLYLKWETDDWVASFRAAGIACRPLKGVYLSLLLYGDLGAKACADIDLLLRAEDLPLAEEVAAGRGFRHSSNPEAPVRDPSDKSFHLEKTDSVAEYTLDLHRSLDDPQMIPFPLEDFMPPPGSPEQGGEKTPEENSLPPELVGTFLCLHLWRHALTLKTLIDFAAFVHRFDDKIPAVAGRLEQAHARDGLVLALALADRALGVRSRHLSGRCLKQPLLPWLERCLHLPYASQGDYFKWLVWPLEFDGPVRPLGRLASHLLRREESGDARLRLGSRLARFARAAGRAASSRHPLVIRKEHDVRPR